MRTLAMLLPLLVLMSLPAMATSALESHRARFLDAWERLALRQSVDVESVTKALNDYPLAPYLHWQDLRHRLSDADPREINAFLDRYPTLPVNGLLRSQWLHQLGRDERWETFLNTLDGYGAGLNATLDCYRLRALQAQGDVDGDWIRDARRRWLVGYSQTSVCDPVFSVLYEKDHLDAETRWERIRRIMHAGNAGLARALRGRLEPDQREWLDHWLAVAGNPGRYLRDPGFDLEDPRGREIVLHGLDRLARLDRALAMEMVEHYRELDALTEDAYWSVRRDIALRAAWARDPEALDWFEALPEQAMTDQVREWTARVALGAQNWSRLLSAIWALPLAEQNRAEWRYWKAEALRRTGSEESALEVFSELARERHYYGFLAADRLGTPYVMNHRPTPVDEQRLEKLKQRPDIRRAREFHALGLSEEARREWLAALSGMREDDLRQVAVLAARWGWHDRAVHTANRVSLHDDLNLRFPVAWEPLFREHAAEQGVDLALALAIGRKESAFTPDARSPVGALGLMQVMPGTGARVASRLGLPAPGTTGLLEPGVNLRLGSAYLARMLARFDGNLIMAAAAYNAGPGRVEDWREDNAGVPAAVWIENITYGETRDYVKSILAFRVVYDWQLGRDPRRLAQVMPTMPGPGESGPAIALRDAASR